MTDITPRQGTLSRAILWPEVGGWNRTTDILDGFVIPLADVDGFRTDQARDRANVYTGSREPRGSVLGMVGATGQIPIALEFTFVGHLLDAFFGHGQYSRIGTQHRWKGFGAPGSFQLEKQFLEDPPLVLRNSGLKPDVLEFSQAMSGQARYNLTALGSGDEFRTTLDGIDNGAGAASITDEGYRAVNYFFGYLKKNGTALATITAFTLQLRNNLSRQDAAFHGGKAAAINAGLGDAQGTLGLIFTTEDGFNFYDEAINNEDVSLECLWADGPLEAAPTSWLRFSFPITKVSRASIPVGGAAGQSQTQTWMAEFGTAEVAADVVGSVGVADDATITIGAGAKIGVKIDGAATQVISITAGTRTMDQIVADFSALTGGTAENFMGHLRIATDTEDPVTGSIQIDTASVGSIHATLGFDGTARTSFAAKSVLAEVVNGKSTDY